jgi:transcriptional regulator with XRE-family HTH domain
VRITNCDACGHETTTVRNELQLFQVLGLGLLKRPVGMLGEELRYLRKLFRLTQAEFAERLSLPRRETVAEWEAKERIFATPREEIALRVLLVNLFRERILEGDRCRLEDSHRASFGELEAGFVERAARMLASKERAPRKGKIGIRHQPRKKRWSEDFVGIR